LRERLKKMFIEALTVQTRAKAHKTKLRKQARITILNQEGLVSNLATVSAELRQKNVDQVWVEKSESVGALDV